MKHDLFLKELMETFKMYTGKSLPYVNEARHVFNVSTSLRVQTIRKQIDTVNFEHQYIFFVSENW